MTLRGVTYQGPPIEDFSRLDAVPPELGDILIQINGFIAYGGGLHVRGLCDEPFWHSLDRYRAGEMALRALFPNVQHDDIPFAQDYLGNQFLLRDQAVWRLRADTGEASLIETDLPSFFGRAREDAVGYLSLELLARHHAENGPLEPGELVHAMPPPVLKPDDSEISLRAVPVANAVSFLAAFSKQIRDIPDGTQVNLKLVDPNAAD